jgi:hypothetical protein
MMGGLKTVDPVDRFVVPVSALRSVSPEIGKDLKEGIRAANAGCSRAATVMLRRALERATNEVGGPSDTLAKKIGVLKERGIMTAIQAGQAHNIRVFANVYGAHPKDDFLDEVADDEIDAAVKLTVAVIEGLAKAVKERPSRPNG